MRRAFPKVLLFCLFAPAAMLSYAQKITREEYILKYKDIAVDQMERYGIPASIKMAQALLESNNGNSRLAGEANNHFGIKCKSDWRGETINHSDDAENECFRKYSSAEESFEDHAVFLDNSPRYNSLFKLEPTDYRGWAYGLKAAGYATNPNYPEMLIRIIEDNKLYMLDDIDRAKDITYQDIRRETPKVVIDESAPGINVDEFNVTIDRQSGRPIRYNNGTAYILAAANDSFYSISSDFGITISKLLKYNDIPAAQGISEGDMLYVKPKGKRSENGQLLYIIEAGETMHAISQKFGIRLNNLYKINNMRQGDTVRVGQQLRLR